ncbi:2-oxoglutarate dehydrogenase E1 component [Gilvibacter sp. SZ-19]|jgi:2-oxoglutarate dehydrogenase E1 component|uniref:2-oxoglutarate dehydrogenase E1 component n=1 Tax=unclassified Gilvibacter TaxID=2625242 RepID=UPI000B3C1DD6|nr:2-oxoglutarate dehydrogenase E1 component [Gilvibacter sp. SZ-19]ARV11607.1 2-oxoglutarate dehydrogenase E1 component [Gilvibacter sp. SZ-19]
MDKYSFLNAVHTSYLASLYDQYLQFPDSVEPSWRAFFQGFDFGIESGSLEALGIEAVPGELIKEFRVVNLIDGYRGRGHLFTRTNPVRERRKYSPTLELSNFDLSDEDMDTEFEAGSILGLGKTTLRQIIAHLEAIYCDSIGVEYMYIRKPEEVKWIQNWLNNNDNHPKFSAEEKKHLLKKLNEAISFESFLHSKYVGQKRFSVEGVDALIPGLDTLIERGADMGIEQFVVGMAHRGRLNVLANIFGKSPEDIFSEFDSKEYDEEELFDGDVKYHMGWTSFRSTDQGKQIRMDLAPNPSHLETVNAVVEGIARAKLDNQLDGNEKAILPILIHGDAAIAGQGVVYEVIQMAQLDGYRTGGTIHIVANNQVGFTTNYLDARSSTYCTDVGKVTLSPVLHVNADDVEAVAHAFTFALEYRMQFGRDVFLDVLGYRKYGHNEGDEPRFTQPKLYKAISKHKNPRDIYAERLINEGVIDEDYVKKLESDYKSELEEDLEASRKREKTVITEILADDWEDYILGDIDDIKRPVNTSFNQEILDSLATGISQLPEDKKFMRKIQRIVEDRKKRYFEGDNLDWAMGELLAYATLMHEGFNVRITGQDVERGTFSHRHAVIKTEDDAEEINLHNDLDTEGKMYIYNSLLSEYGVVGFDYGYAMAAPRTLTIWEAQFGDFSNGAQIMLDQYISAAEAKWKTQNGLVMLLPHGYEGQGSEHSSARMERYLQLCSRQNMIVADVTTPANLFHLLRRHMKWNFRKPLIVFTPKSLLRHPKVVSTKEELATGSFQTVIDDPQADKKKIKSLVFCTGKFYYDLDEYREEQGRDDVALVRLEQLFPLPTEELKEIIDSYPNVTDYVWAQEEPRNMGAWGFMLMNFDLVKLRVASRHVYSAPAAGSSTRSKARHKRVIESVFETPES